MRAILGLGLLVATAADAAETITYTYDARGRLVAVSRAGTVNDGTATTYAYDKADNRTTVTTTTGGGGGMAAADTKVEKQARPSGKATPK